MGYCSKKVRESPDDQKVPLMGVLGAFIFAAQMINFSNPGTGSSGHLGGGLLLAILLGPYAAFLTMASVLTVQALFFADGGLLALGANIFNLGVFPCFVAYPLIYKPIAGEDPTPGRITFASVAAAVVGLQLGAFGVVVETVVSGISELPFKTFVLFMQPIHLAIGGVEGLVTAAVITFVARAQPEILSSGRARTPPADGSFRKTAIALGAASLVTAGVLSWFASTHPDGLEWSVAGATRGEEAIRPEGRLQETLGKIQDELSFLPGYGRQPAAGAAETPQPGKAAKAWPRPAPATSAASLVGGLLTLAVAFAVGWGLRRRRTRP